MLNCGEGDVDEDFVGFGDWRLDVGDGEVGGFFDEGRGEGYRFHGWMDGTVAG